ncbi:MAG: [FeFe] hydrogenase, group A [Acutalibacteraceae bacterium]
MGGVMYIDGKRVPFTDEKNVLAVIRKAGIDMPTLCYYSELSTYGACRMCVVENEWGGIDASCSMVPRDGMKIKTNSAKLLKHRKMIIELLLSSHKCDCAICGKSGSCKLQELAFKFGVRNIRFEDTREQLTPDTSSPSIVRDPNKCILCGDCVRVCSELQGMNILDFAYRGSELRVMPAFNAPLSETKCIGCGQCAAVCPTVAIRIKKDIAPVWEAIFDPNKRVVAQVAPAVRVALGEQFNIDGGENVMGKLVAAMRFLGFDHVYDTTLGADFTVVEEAKEFLDRFKNGGKFPMFTSCCPAWVKYVCNSKPELLDNISSCKSPMQMFSPLIKRYYAEQDAASGIEKETVVVAIMPCTAKKGEAAREEFINNGVRDTDFVLTTQEIADMIRESGIVFDELESVAPGMPLGLGSGAGVIFGTTGGVAEAVVRYCVDDKHSSVLDEIEMCGVRGLDDVKEATLELDGQEVKIAVVHGLKSAQELIKKIENGELFYHLIEVMACKTGCVGGAGQPIGSFGKKKTRADGLYNADRMSQIKRSEENPMLVWLYNTLVRDDAHKLFHVHYNPAENK